MTARQLFTWIQGYYGQYNNVMGPEVLAYLGQKNERYLDSLQGVIKRTHSAQYGKGPDIKALLGMADETLTRMTIEKGLPDVVREEQRMIAGPPEERAHPKYFDADPNIQKLKEKWEKDQNKKDHEPLDYKRVVEALPWLNEVRGDEKVTLSDRYNKGGK